MIPVRDLTEFDLLGPQAPTRTAATINSAAPVLAVPSQLPESAVMEFKYYFKISPLLPYKHFPLLPNSIEQLQL